MREPETVAVLKPRAALYAGVWFRSRLEATWAAYFQAHGMLWQYEERAFEFPDGTRYLPDFWLPDSRAWFEVKGQVDETDRLKILNLAEHAQHRDELVLVGGSPAGAVFGEVTPSGEFNEGVSFARCAHCDSWTLSMAMCRYCGHVDLERGSFIDTCSPGRGCVSRCMGAWLWRDDAPERSNATAELPVRWARASVEMIGRAFKVINPRIR